MLTGKATLAVLRALAAAAALFAASAFAGIEYDSVWTCDRDRFNWYCDAKEPAPASRAQEKPETAIERLERLQRALREARALAILEPTPENVAAYIRMQNEVGQMASTFSDVWRRVIWQNPDLNYELKRPVNNAAIDTYNKERWQAQMQAIERIRNEWGLFFVFRSDCPYCHRLAPTLRMLTDMYGITVFPVSVDGTGLPEYPNPERDNGMVARLGITQVPMLLLANVKDKRIVPIASGVVALHDILDRIYVLTSTTPGSLY